MKKKFVVILCVLLCAVAGGWYLLNSTAIYDFDEVCGWWTGYRPCTAGNLIEYGASGPPMPGEVIEPDPFADAVDTLLTSFQYQRAYVWKMPDGGIALLQFGGCVPCRYMGYWDGSHIWFPNTEGKWSAYTPSEGFEEALRDLLKTYCNIDI